MTKPLISVVVPLYRVEAEMPLCVDSVLAQTYDRLDVILVDDGSPDGCGRLAEDYARRDARVRAIHRENGGLSAARNTGTLAAKGDYITYVDGDDFLHPVCVESLYGLIERYRADLAVCTMKTFQEKPDEVIRQTTGQTACFQREKALEHMLYQRLFDTSACGKLYRTEDARGQLFPVGRLFEDLATVYRFLWRAERTAWESDALYGYRTRGDSIMNQRFHEGRFDELTAIDELCDFVRENCPSVQRAADCRRFSCLCQTLLAIPPEDARYRGRAEAIFAELCRLRWRVLSDPRARMKNRGAAALTLLGERGFRRCAAARG